MLKGPERRFDLVIWGATGFTGQLVCGHIAGCYQGNVSWALAGRNESKMKKVKGELAESFPGSKGVPILLGDASEESSLLAITSQAKVLLSTAGPFLTNGTQVVNACIKSGTHYADINGELPWMKQIIASHHDAAMAAGVKIVVCCGWDCIPADLGTLYVTDYVKTQMGRKTGKVVNLITDIVGEFSGGSLATALTFYANPQEGINPDPYSLDPPGSRRGSDRAQYWGVGWNKDAGLYTSPSFFGPANMRIVRRSNALLGNAYGDDFQYDEVFGHKSFLKALVTTLGLIISGAILMFIARVPILTRLLKAVSPKQGEGPSRAMQLEGRWECMLVGTTQEVPGTKPRVAHAILRGRGDPGYYSTSRMLLEAGMCLVKGEAGPDALKGGILTPATAIGQPLIERLKKAGIDFSIAHR